MSGADMIMQVVADEGVDTIFGYCGGAILPTYDAVFRYNDQHRGDDGLDPIPLIVPANEQGAGFMAAGYAGASGSVGVVMVTSGYNNVAPGDGKGYLYVLDPITGVIEKKIKAANELSRIEDGTKVQQRDEANVGVLARGVSLSQLHLGVSGFGREPDPPAPPFTAVKAVAIAQTP